MGEIMGIEEQKHTIWSFELPLYVDARQITCCDSKSWDKNDNRTIRVRRRSLILKRTGVKSGRKAIQNRIKSGDLDGQFCVWFEKNLWDDEETRTIYTDLEIQM